MALLILLMLMQSLMPQIAKDCSCRPAEESHCTEWGHIYFLSRDSRSESIRQLKGKVTDLAHAPLWGAIVEIYPLGSRDPQDWSFSRDILCNERLIACIIDESGEFAFNLPSGDYEVRASLDGFNTIAILITIDNDEGKEKNTDICLPYGT